MRVHPDHHATAHPDLLNLVTVTDVELGGHRYFEQSKPFLSLSRPFGTTSGSRRPEERCGDEGRVGDPLRITYLPSKPAVSTAGSPIGELGDGIFITVLVSTMLAVAVGRGATRPFMATRRRPT
jgi:hypothetical protein